jgi:hypothetical protein
VQISGRSVQLLERHHVLRVAPGVVRRSHIGGDLPSQTRHHNPSTAFDSGVHQLSGEHPLVKSKHHSGQGVSAATRDSLSLHCGSNFRSICRCHARAYECERTEKHSAAKLGHPLATQPPPVYPGHPPSPKSFDLRAFEARHGHYNLHPAIPVIHLVNRRHAGGVRYGRYSGRRGCKSGYQLPASRFLRDPRAPIEITESNVDIWSWSWAWKPRL